MNIIILYKCTWCGQHKEHEISVTQPDKWAQVHISADDYRVCPPCRVKFVPKSLNSN